MSDINTTAAIERLTDAVNHLTHLVASILDEEAAREEPDRWQSFWGDDMCADPDGTEDPPEGYEPIGPWKVVNSSAAYDSNGTPYIFTTWTRPLRRVQP